MIFLKQTYNELDFIYVLATNRQRSARTPWKRGANAVETQCIQQERRANTVKRRASAMKCQPELHRNAVERRANSVATHWTQRGRHVFLFSQIKYFFLGVLAAFWEI